MSSESALTKCSVAPRARKRRNRFWGALAGVFLVLALAASASAVYAWQQLKTNEAFLNATLKRATEIVDEAVKQAEKYNVPRTATLALLDKAEGIFDDMAQYGQPTPELRYRKAWMLIQFARNYRILGDTGKQLARANEAHRLLAGLAAQKPNDVTYQESLSAAFDEVGDVRVAQGNLTEALKSYRDSLAIMERLARTDPSNAGWQRGLTAVNERLGIVYKGRGETDEAKAAFQRALAIYDNLTARFPDDTLALVNSTVPLIRLGELGPDGRAYLQKALTILKQLDEAGRLEPRRKSSIAQIEAQLARLQEEHPPEADLQSAR